MDKDLQPELKGSSIEAIAAKQQIAKHFKQYGDSGHQEAKKHQLMYASKIMCVISKCENKHLDVYCSIVVDIFSHQLCPEASAKYWSLYVNCMRYFHYLLVDKKEFEKASLIYRHISAYKNKLQNTENGLIYINIYCYHLFLQSSLKSKNPQQALSEATDVVDNLTKLFYDILETNKQQNFQYPDILKKAMTWLFPQNRPDTVYQFLKILPEEKIKEMFQALFTLFGHQTIDIISNEENVQEQAIFIMETIYTLLQVDILDKMHLQLSVNLLENCRIECRIKTNKPMTDSFHLLHDYLKLLCNQKNTTDFQSLYYICCERYGELFEKYSKIAMNEAWFGNFLVLIFFLHSQLQNLSVFTSFWRQMVKPDSFKAMFKLFVELMKLAPCILPETKLFTINCCRSTRKHVILSFAQIALAGFVFYCQNVSAEDEISAHHLENSENNTKDYYSETIENSLLLIINHVFKIIDKMDCISSASQEIDIILTRFKQVTVSCKTYKQACTCVSICELFLKIKSKIAPKEWPLLLRRLYKTVAQLNTDSPSIGRELQMCYIVSMLHDATSQIDINQIRTQINIFYGNSDQQPQQDCCLLHIYHTANTLLRPHLEPSRKKLLHWLETQHVLKYYKSNTTLLHSILKSSQSHYDFVLITKQAKLQTYAMGKISSLYKTLRSKEKECVVLSRLEQLTFAHLCVILLNDMNTYQILQLDSKDLGEDKLENLFLREEISSITIYNDLKRFTLAWEAFKAFKEFYEKFDSETISMDDAVIDWECILDDLASVALYLELFGYVEHSSEVWLLHYKCSRLIQDDISALRALTFFCEYSEQYEKNSNCIEFKLEEEIENNFPTIIQGMKNVCNLQRQTYRSYILLAVLQIAHYYARTSRFSFAQMLLQHVQQKHAELTERQGRYDIVLATMDLIKFRLLWKNFDDTNDAVKENASRTTAEKLLLHRCLLHEVEETLDRFHLFSYTSSSDGLLYSILIINFVQELAECTVNRLCDNFINALFIAACRCTLLAGLALRFVQVMSMWMWVNLQMEHVEKAQVKLKLIEYVMGTKNLKELKEKCTKSLSDIKSNTVLPTACSKLLSPFQHNPGMEAIRKLAEVQLSPLKSDKLQLSPSHRSSDLKRFFKCNIDTKLLPQNEQIEWTYFLVGCLNARLYFLVENYDQLETFYERGSKWIQLRQNDFNKNYYKNIQLMAMQHYANFLRARGQYDKALQCVQYGLELCENNNFNIDAVYYVNFQLQLTATQKEINWSKNLKFELPTHSKLRRALHFNISPEMKNQQTPAKSDLKVKMMPNLLASGKNLSKIKSLSIQATDVVCSLSKKAKTEGGIDSSGSNSISGSNSSLDVKSTKPKSKFEICEDSFEIVEIIDSVENVVKVDEAKSVKRSKAVEINEQQYKTPKVVRKTSKSAKTTGGKSGRSVKYKRPQNIPQFQINISLTDSPSSSPIKSASSALSENLEAKENLITNELVATMQNLEIKSPQRAETETKSSKSRRKPDHITEAGVVTIVLEDSPCTANPIQSARKTRAKPKDESSNGHLTGENNLASSSRPRRQKKLEIDSKKKMENIPSTATSPIVTRRRQKNLV